jgi:hypothetical protein
MQKYDPFLERWVEVETAFEHPTWGQSPFAEPQPIDRGTVNPNRNAVDDRTTINFPGRYVEGAGEIASQPRVPKIRR